MWKTGKTLEGEKLRVYVVLKILKKMFKTDLSSYILKYSVDQALQDKKYTTEEIGKSLKAVLKYHLLDGEFTEDSEIAEQLKNIGVAKISIEHEGIRFQKT